MGKQIILSKKFAETIANYFQWEYAESIYKDLVNQEIQELQQEIKSIEDKRAFALKHGCTLQESYEQYPIGILMNQVETLSKLHKNISAQLQHIIKQILITDTIDRDLFYASYVQGVKCQDYTSSGDVEIHINKLNTKNITVPQGGFINIIASWLKHYECKNTDNFGAIQRFTRRILSPIGSMIEETTNEQPSCGYIIKELPQLRFEKAFLTSIRDRLLKVKLLADVDLQYTPLYR